jgi:hypothetical protein
VLQWRAACSIINNCLGIRLGHASCLCHPPNLTLNLGFYDHLRHANQNPGDRREAGATSARVRCYRNSKVLCSSKLLRSLLANVSYECESSLAAENVQQCSVWPLRGRHANSPSGPEHMPRSVTSSRQLNDKKPQLAATLALQKSSRANNNS